MSSLSVDKNIAIAAGCGTLTTPEGEKFVGKGADIAVTLGDSVCGCSCFKVFKVLKWEECDTIAKKIGFLFGKTINLFINGLFIACKKLKYVYKILYLDRIVNLFNKILSNIFTKISKVVNLIFSNVIKPIFVNKFTNTISQFLRKYIFEPIFKIDINRTASSPSKLRQTISKIIKFINGWTFRPIYDRILSPIGRFISETFHGIASGCYQPISTKKEDNKS